MGKPTLNAQVIHFVNKPMPGGLPKRTARALLDIEDPKIVPIIRDPAQGRPRIRTRCSTFPAAAPSGCSARWASPRRRCSTTWARSACCRRGICAAAIRRPRRARRTRGREIITDNRVLFHRVANTLNYLDIKTVIVSCGTCLDQLEKYEFDKIFPGSRLLDIHEYLLEKGVKLDGVHAACATCTTTPATRRSRRTSRSKVVNAADGQRGDAERTLLRRVRARSP